MHKKRKRQRHGTFSATQACTADVAKSVERVPVSKPGFLPTLTTNSIIAFVDVPSAPPQQVWALW
jgi:hypothetical protein